MAEETAQAFQDELNENASDHKSLKIADHDEACEDDDIDDVLAARFRASKGFCIDDPDLDPFLDEDPSFDTAPSCPDDWIPDHAMPSSANPNDTTPTKSDPLVATWMGGKCHPAPLASWRSCPLSPVCGWTRLPCSAFCNCQNSMGWYSLLSHFCLRAMPHSL